MVLGLNHVITNMIVIKGLHNRQFQNFEISQGTRKLVQTHYKKEKKN